MARPETRIGISFTNLDSFGAEDQENIVDAANQIFRDIISTTAYEKFEDILSANVDPTDEKRQNFDVFWKLSSMFAFITWEPQTAALIKFVHSRLNDIQVELQLETRPSYTLNVETTGVTDNIAEIMLYWSAVEKRYSQVRQLIEDVGGFDKFSDWYATNIEVLNQYGLPSPEELDNYTTPEKLLAVVIGNIISSGALLQESDEIEQEQEDELDLDVWGDEIEGLDFSDFDDDDDQ